MYMTTETSVGPQSDSIRALKSFKMRDLTGLGMSTRQYVVSANAVVVSVVVASEVKSQRPPPLST